MKNTAISHCENITVMFEDTGDVLINPGMGFVFFYYSNEPEHYGSMLSYDDTLDDFPGLSTIYLRMPWGLLEPEEGKFDWSWLDAPAQRWMSKGKRLALRFTTSESWLRYATPKWVYSSGAKYVPMVAGMKDKYSGEPSIEPDFGDPVYLEKLNNFLSAAAERYDGDPGVEFVDIGSFGLWGEGHTWQGTRTHYSYDVLFKHLDIHAENFQKSRLVVNDNHLDQDYGNSELVQFCQNQKMGIRNDSICCLEKNMPFREITLHMTRAFWMTSPVILEAGHYGQCKNQLKSWNSENVLRAVNELHASYCSIHWWPREFLEAERSLVNKVNRILGYRFQLKEASWPMEIDIREPWNFKAKWYNAGVAPLYESAFPALTFKDARGGIAAVFVDEAMDMRRVLPDMLGESSPSRYVQESCFASCSRILPGEYDMYVSIGSRTGLPQIALPLLGSDGNRRYKIGRIRVLEGAGPNYYRITKKPLI